jgi:hypothetical protein
MLIRVLPESLSATAIRARRLRQDPGVSAIQAWRDLPERLDLGHHGSRVILVTVTGSAWLD